MGVRLGLAARNHKGQVVPDGLPLDTVYLEDDVPGDDDHEPDKTSNGRTNQILLHLSLLRVCFAHKHLSKEPDKVDDPKEGQEKVAGQVVDPTDAQALLVTQVIQVHFLLTQLS